MTGAERIAAERQRQIEAEGWTPEHDDQYKRRELTRAAACYIEAAASPLGHKDERITLSGCWPWKSSWWKPSPDPIRNLEKAGALIAAEIDRLQRAAEGKGNA